MPKLIASIDGVVVKEVQLTKDRTTMGRRPYNDVVLDNLAVSGEHAAIQMKSGVATLEDLGSTNGTYVNGKPIRKQTLVHDDLIEMGRYKIKYIDATGATVPGSLGPAARAQASSGFSAAPTVPAAPPVLKVRPSARAEQLRLRTMHRASIAIRIFFMMSPSLFSRRRLLGILGLFE